MIVRDSGGNIALFTTLAVFGRLEDRFFTQQSKEKQASLKQGRFSPRIPSDLIQFPPHIWRQAFDLRMDQVRS